MWVFFRVKKWHGSRYAFRFVDIIRIISHTDTQNVFLGFFSPSSFVSDFFFLNQHIIPSGFRLSE